VVEVGLQKTGEDLFQGVTLVGWDRGVGREDEAQAMRQWVQARRRVGLTSGDPVGVGTKCVAVAYPAEWIASRR
jgi:hypothetical protein